MSSWRDRDREKCWEQQERWESGGSQDGFRAVEHLFPPMDLNPGLASPISCWDAPCHYPRPAVPLQPWGQAGEAGLG